jgi:hypothetical protein
MYRIARERDRRTAPLYSEINRVQRDDSKPAEWRERRIKELRAEAEGIVAIAAREIEAAAEAARRSVPDGPTKPTADERAEADHVFRKCERRTRGERKRHLPADVAAALDAGDVAGARAVALAADQLGVSLGEVSGRLDAADPRLAEAREQRTLIEAARELAHMEAIRSKRAAAIPFDKGEGVKLLTFMQEWGLHPGASFIDQPPGSGPSQAEWPEPYDPELDRQREAVARARAGSEVVDPAERYAAAEPAQSD